jgi:hypothetical protein
VTGFSARRIGNWTFTAYGVVMPLPPDLTGRVKQDVPNRADMRRACRATRAANPSDPQSSSGQGHRVPRGSSPQTDAAQSVAVEPAREWPRRGNPGSNPGAEQETDQ